MHTALYDKLYLKMKCMCPLLWLVELKVLCVLRTNGMNTSWRGGTCLRMTSVTTRMLTEISDRWVTSSTHFLVVEFSMLALASYCLLTEATLSNVCIPFSFFQQNTSLEAIVQVSQTSVSLTFLTSLMSFRCFLMGIHHLPLSLPISCCYAVM